MKLFLGYKYLLPILLLGPLTASAQNKWTDSVKTALVRQKEDTNKVNTLLALSDSYQLNYPDSGFAYAQRALALAEKLHFETGIFWAEITSSHTSMILGNYPLELDYAFKAFSLSKKLNSPRTTGVANAMMTAYYYSLGEYATCLNYWHEVQRITERWFPGEIWGIWLNLSWIYQGMKKPDSAMLYARKAYEEIKANRLLYKEDYDSKKQTSGTFTVLGNGFAGEEEYDSALYYYHKGIPAVMNGYLELNALEGYNGIAAVYKATGRLDSAVWYTEKVLATRMAKSYPVSLLKAANLLSDIYELKKKPDSTLKYLRLAAGLKDSLFNREKMIAIQNLTYKEQENRQALEAAKIQVQNRYKLYFLIAAFTTILMVASIIVRNKRQRQLQNMRNSIADDLHDDIGSALSSISIMSELAKARPPEALPLLDSIGESTHLLQENMSDIVWAVNPRNDRFENVLQRMNQFASEILEAKNIEFDFSSDATLSATRLKMEQRKNFYLFFKEVINNAAKYSEATKVSVAISQKDQHIEMNIKDNGKGFDMGSSFNGNGMSTLKKRGEELNADFTIKSYIQAGTAVNLKFKIT